ncbi:hypothetical protein B4589_004800 [Halolamina sp. CBA1230]|uniref:hypothetical protein n=1 Tax=Halolamina sp. CBA1230 TaxID=1853690 RepID=UPI0013019CE4|nr:hypothetical protein [Halolamina sp. CBA1230]QKY19732.1 hypothetical protein B4589_004800 [Halolamina sp. CBA1230]
MVDLPDAAFVLGFGLLAWLGAVTFTDGWSEPVVAVWGAVLTLGVAAAFLVADELELTG